MSKGVMDRTREKRLQRAVSRSRLGSNTRRKRVRSLSKEAYRYLVRNRNYCHELTTTLVKRYGLVALEDLRALNMSRSARGTVEEPGRNVAAKSGLNRSILEQTWGMIRRQLTYKAEWAGRGLVVVDPRYTSQTCSRCGVVDADARRSESYECAACGIRINLYHPGRWA